MPERWTCSSQIIDPELKIQTATTAVHLLRDELGNSCSEFVKNRSGAH
jgi:hypothetical protein